MDRLDAMSLLLTVVEAGSLSAAGRRLGMPLATVSRRLSDLETRLNTRLLDRSGRRAGLTDAGRAYAEACRRILGEVDEAERAAAGEYSTAKGELVITAPIVFGRLHMTPVVVDFLKAYPDIDLRLVLADRVLNLAEERIDLALRIGALPESSLVAVRVGRVRPVVCAAPAYLAARGSPGTPEDLNRHDGITFEGMAAGYSWRFGKIDAHPRIRLSAATAEVAVQAAVAGVGITRVLSYQAAEALASGALERVLQAAEPEPWPVSLVYAARPLLPLKLRAFLDFAAPRLRERLAA